MLDNFDPKEKKAILIFFALLLLAIVYLYTHELPWERNFSPEQNPADEFERSPDSAKKSYERIL